MNTWLASTRDTFKTQLWPAPVIAVVAALLFGVGLPQLDATIDGDLSGRVNDWLFGGDADAARSLLGAIASSLITVTALTFSLTVVTLQLASSQFSPRLLRTFTSDQFVQATLALFSGDLHLRADRPARGAQRRRQRPERVRAEARGHVGLRARRGQRAGARAVLGTSHRADPGGDDVAQRASRRLEHDEGRALRA